jgi:hypothetical protein
MRLSHVEDTEAVVSKWTNRWFYRRKWVNRDTIQSELVASESGMIMVAIKSDKEKLYHRVALRGKRLCNIVTNQWLSFVYCIIEECKKLIWNMKILILVVQRI